MLSGTRLLTSQPCSASCNWPKIGNAVNTANATVKNGTSARMVVKVRLLAVSPRWSARKRSRRVWAVVFQGKRDRSPSSASMRRAATDNEKGKDMTDMMPPHHDRIPCRPTPCPAFGPPQPRRRRHTLAGPRQVAGADRPVPGPGGGGGAAAAPRPLGGAPRAGGVGVGVEGAGTVPAAGRPAEEPHVHLPLGQPGDLALLHRRRGARLGGQAPVAMAGLGRGGAVPGAVCRLRSACAIAPAPSLAGGARTLAGRDTRARHPARPLKKRTPPMTPLLDTLAALVGPAHVITDGDLCAWEQDWRRRVRGKALAVGRPANTQQVTAVVQPCAAAGTAIVPQGGNTGLTVGSISDASGTQIVLALTRMNAVRSIDADNLTLTAEAGCILHNLQAAAHDAGLLFPLSLAAQGSCTIGGNLGTNAGGTQGLRYGNARELCLGLEVVTPQGQCWDGLRGLRKDNTGYDLRDLFIGSEGTLGIITAATDRKSTRLNSSHQI